MLAFLLAVLSTQLVLPFSWNHPNNKCQLFIQIMTENGIMSNTVVVMDPPSLVFLYLLGEIKKAPVGLIPGALLHMNCTLLNL